MTHTLPSSRRKLVAAVLVLASPTLALAQAPAPQPAAPKTQQAASGQAGNLQPATREAQSLASLAPLVESVKSAVVNVDVQARPEVPEGMEDNPLFDRFFGGNGRGRGGGRSEREQIRQGAGSGFIIDPKGLVLTNNHVIEDAVTITIRLDDGRSFSGEVVGRDPLTDVAVVKIKEKVDQLPTVKLGDSDAVRVGDWVLAIGNPFGLASSVSVGILSARAREIGASVYDDFLQTDAAINPGNSGGPLFNMKGEVVGINTAIVGGGTGIGFSVPSNLIKALLPQLEKEGAVTRGWLGVGIQPLTRELGQALKLSVSEGAILTQITPDSPAAKAGLKPDDVVVAVDGKQVRSDSDLTRTVALKKPNSVATLSLFRDGKKQDVKVTMGTRPDLEGLSKKKPGATDEQDSSRRVGLSLQDLDARTASQAGFTERAGALITDIVPGSPADRAQLTPGMLVVEANKKPIASAKELAAAIRAAPKGSTLLLRVAGPGGGRLLRALTVP
ncbi:Do family serine endopeptidase [Corallococcus exiguus]|uniref:Do family serine endopeptidase n=1 Tax=Corallococcus TaxID=83461 RepID=UPI000EC6EE9A|nr:MULTISPECIES: Do family serine endopeptidase [Corallococcus]NNB91539.1 Do family serine endopeptidase [Corallococcus exiguus]NNB99665.1 Do family serine endopeptidase [Corallococcus exiguus]NNC08565.1 Do family serine endopeptidase [Corallococcus exiguus]NPC52545.1 Do family serine endopeptidase [Corallococcus exiguus]RKH74487.1 Do family serine endopeptidase [Corallococcus sp. AB032C]